MKKLLTIVNLLIWCVALPIHPANSRSAADSALARISEQIIREQQAGNIEKEGEARWQKIVTLKNFSLTEQQAGEALVQMKWFEEHKQWDNYYRCWQLRANALCALGKLQQALQETQRMLDDAQEHGNMLGRAMAYKQIGIIYLNMKQTEPAVEALQHYAELMKDEQDDISSLSNIYYRMAKAYDYDHSYEKELQVADRWLEFLQERDTKGDKHFYEYYNSCYLARAAAFMGRKMFDSTAHALRIAAHNAWQSNTSLSLHHYYKMQARYHLAKGDPATALRYTDSVSYVTNEKDDHTAEVRAKALILLGRGAEAALIYQRLYHERDSVFSQETRQHLDELNALFQIDELKTEQQRTKLLYLLLTGASIVLALLVLLLYGWRSAIRQKKANEQLRIANERAKASSKMKTEFIRNISHEIRTPLNIISGFTQILTMPDMEIPDDQKADIKERIEENTDYITKIVDRMLELSDASSETVIERCDQTETATLVAEAIRHSRIAQHTRPENAEAKVEFACLCTEEPPASLLTNKRYAVRALAQLLENAVKFTPQGSITLSIETTEESIRFVVEDTGLGIPADQTEHVFDEFVQLDSFAAGTGIGLPIARSIAQRMGGALWLDTTYTKGARFILELPRA